MSTRCPNCGSPYVDVNFGTGDYQCYCQSCKKRFFIPNPYAKKRAVGQQKKLVRFEGEWAGISYLVTIIRDETGGIYTDQYKITTGDYVQIIGPPKLYVKVWHDGVAHLTYDSFKSPNDHNGQYVYIEKITLYDELKEKAMLCEAMRATWSDVYDCFYIKDNHNRLMLSDIVAFLQPIVGIPVGTKTQKSDACYVATAVYGSYDCPQVWTLRRFRDNILAQTWYGRTFIQAYYAISPSLVKRFGNTEWFRKLWKGSLDRMVAKLQANGFESTPYEDRNL